MTGTTFFLKDIRIPSFRQSLSAVDKSILDNYLDEMAGGPGDGNMDIEWQDSGKGYYLHDHILESIKSETERNQFLRGLRDDIDAWLSEEPKNYMVISVRDRLFTESHSVS